MVGLKAEIIGYLCCVNYVFGSGILNIPVVATMLSTSIRFNLSSVLRSVRPTERLVSKVTIVSLPNWVERVRIY